ncbi:MAG: hypothetical protein K0Q94_6554, partial [Paenibacillus sp.]|nr:hypothetical protein [Paenibacillus sp.]
PLKTKLEMENLIIYLHKTTRDY